MKISPLIPSSYLQAGWKNAATKMQIPTTRQSPITPGLSEIQLRIDIMVALSGLVRITKMAKLWNRES
jgi:hypothetical protein